MGGVPKTMWITFLNSPSLSQELLHDARHIVKKTIEDSLGGMHPINLEYVKDKVSDDIARFLLQKTAKRPIVIPVLLGV